jgi:hypothetical protein
VVSVVLLQLRAGGRTLVVRFPGLRPGLAAGAGGAAVDRWCAAPTMAQRAFAKQQRALRAAGCERVE